MKGAVVREDCPYYQLGMRSCLCKPRCKVCGGRKHTGIHGPTIEDPRAGAEIWKGGHLFVPKGRKPPDGSKQ